MHEARKSMTEEEEHRLFKRITDLACASVKRQTGKVVRLADYAQRRKRQQHGEAA
jgi:hypothetical protein